MKNTTEILFHDEIADILNRAGNGAEIELYNGNYKICFLFYHESKKYTTIDRIYEWIKNGHTVLIDGENIMNL